MSELVIFLIIFQKIKRIKKVVITFFIPNWKLMIHLLFRTKRFGVNNQWWADFDSMFGYTFWKKLLLVLNPLSFYQNFKQIKFRAAACHFLTKDQINMIGWS